jgi:hypothetical protein
MYSTTYTAEIVKLISVIGLLLGFEIDTDNLTATIGLLLIIGSSAWTLYQRYKAGGVSALGFRR